MNIQMCPLRGHKLFYEFLQFILNFELAFPEKLSAFKYIRHAYPIITDAQN